MRGRPRGLSMFVVFAVAFLSPVVALSAQASADTNPASTASQTKGAGDTTGDPSPAAPAFPGGRPLASLLGMTLAEATSAFGAPVDVFSVRGDNPSEDDVVFYYPDHSYLFWYRNRVWQVRVDRRFTGEAIGVHMGETRGAVEEVLGKPYHVGTSSEIFLLPDRGFPVRARAFYSDNQLSDLYVYRGDY